MTAPITNNNNSSSTTAAGGAAKQPSIDSNAASATRTMMTFDASGVPVLNLEEAARFHALPPAQQRALLESWIAQANVSTDPELKRAVVQLVTGLVSGSNGNFDECAGPVVEQELARLVIGLRDLPTGMLSEQPVPQTIREARERWQNGTATAADRAALAASPQFLTPAEKGRLTVALIDVDRNPALAIGVLESVRSTDEWQAVCRGASNGGSAQQGIDSIRRKMAAVAGSPAFDGAVFRASDRANAIGSPTNPGSVEPLIMSAQAAIDGARMRGGGGTTPSPSDSSSAAAPAAPSPWTTLSDAERVAKYDARYGQLAADGTLDHADALLLATTAIDPEGEIALMQKNDRAFMENIANNPGELERIKEKMSRISFLRDSLIALHDDEISRRKKLVDGFSRA